MLRHLFIRVYSQPVRHSFVDRGSVRCATATADQFVVAFSSPFFVVRRNRAANTATLPLTITASAITQRIPNANIADWPRDANSEKTKSNHPIAPVELTIRNLVVGYLNKPDTIRSAVRVPRINRLKIRVYPPYRSNQREARSVLCNGSNRCAQRDSKTRLPPNFISK